MGHLRWGIVVVFPLNSSFHAHKLHRDLSTEMNLNLCRKINLLLLLHEFKNITTSEYWGNTNWLIDWNNSEVEKSVPFFKNDSPQNGVKICSKNLNDFVNAGILYTNLESVKAKHQFLFILILFFDTQTSETLCICVDLCVSIFMYVHIKIKFSKMDAVLKNVHIQFLFKI